MALSTYIFARLDPPRRARSASVSATEVAAPVTDLSSRLDALLFRSALWLVLAALIAATAAWWLAGANAAMLSRIRLRLFGPPEADPDGEPAARRFLRIAFGVLWIVDGLLQAQPAMPAAFGSDTLAMGLSESPSWLRAVALPWAHLWTRHPVVADAATVWVQIGLGLLLLTASAGLVHKVALWASIVWGLFVWVVGEFLGDLFVRGASWLAGSPGAVLVYVIAAVALLMPWRLWRTGAAADFARLTVGAWFLVGAALQAIPWERNWSAGNLAAPFAAGAAHRQPGIFRRPITEIAHLAVDHPAALNGFLVGVLVAVGVGTCVVRSTSVLVAGLVVCAATWWLAQDFGVLGGTATDPNTALPLALLLAAALPAWQAATVSQPDVALARFGATRAPFKAAVSTLGAGAVIAPLVVGGLLLGPADSDAVAADSGGGVVAIPHRPAPAFELADQNGKTISLDSLKGKLTLVTFFDPVCSDDCPLIANQLAIADRELGSLAGRVEIVAIDSNPIFHNVADVAAFTTSHGLNDLPNWHFLAGSPSQLQDVISAYGIVVQVPSVGMIEHGEGIYFVGANGEQLAYLGDGANESLTQSYADTVQAEVRRLLA